jgi:hypothetical protein
MSAVEDGTGAHLRSAARREQRQRAAQLMRSPICRHLSGNVRDESCSRLVAAIRRNC